MRLMLALMSLCIVGISGPALAADPCGSVELRRGTVVLGQPIAIAAQLPAASEQCLRRVAKALAMRPAVRTVTVAIRLPDRERASWAKKLISRVRSIMIGGGVAERRLSTVAPAAKPGEAAAIHISYRERRSSRAVALITSITGVVRAGRYRGELRPSSKGHRLVAYEYIQTPDADSSARIVLADRSEIRLYPRSLIRVGPVYLTKALKRRVTVDLLAGSIKTHAMYGGAGSQFDIRTRTAVAGVRGTDFRVALAGPFTRVETLGGAVALAGSKSSVPITAGSGSRVDAAGTPEPPRALLARPAGLRPVMGTLAAGGTLSWKPVANAAKYIVELSSDAYFNGAYKTVSTTSTSVSAPASISGAKWFWRVQAVDRDGFVGKPSKVYAVVVR